MAQHLCSFKYVEWKEAAVQQGITPEVGKRVQECPSVAQWPSSGLQQCGNNSMKALNKDHRQVRGVLGGLTVQRRSENTRIKKKREEAQNQGLDLETAAVHQCRTSMGPKNGAQCGRSDPPFPPTVLSLCTHLLGEKACSDKATEGEVCGVRGLWRLLECQNKIMSIFDSKQASWCSNCLISRLLTWAF